MDHQQQTLENPSDQTTTTSSSSRLNAKAPAFVPRTAPPPLRPANRVFHVYHPPMIDYFGNNGFREYDPDVEGLTEELARKITKQVDYYFSDINLATTEQLIRIISKDPEGFVPISIIASFKKIKALVNNNTLLASALRTSSNLIVSEDGKKIKRRQPITDKDVEELQSRIVVAENLPEDHCYQNLMKIFSVVGSVKTIRTCYPHTPNGTATASNISGKLDMYFVNKLHAFVEYETVEAAEKAVAELNDTRNWRSGLRVHIMHKYMTNNGPGRGKGEEDASTSNQPSEKQAEDALQSSEVPNEHVDGECLNDKDGGVRRGKGRGRGARGRGRGPYQYNNHSRVCHVVGAPSAGHIEHPAVTKQPPGPRMPDGTKGFTIGRGRLLVSA